MGLIGVEARAHLEVSLMANSHRGRSDGSQNHRATGVAHASTLGPPLRLREAVSVWACAVDAVLDETRRVEEGGRPDMELLARLSQAVERARWECERAGASPSVGPQLSEVLRLARLRGLQWNQ